MLLMQIMCKSSSALGLDERGTAPATPTLKPEKESDVVVLKTATNVDPSRPTMTYATNVDPSRPTMTSADAASGGEDRAEAKSLAPELLIGEPILPPP
jgi:hypothetical protein